MPTLDQTSLGLDPSSYSLLCEMGVIVPLDRPLVRVHESSQPECWEDTYAGHRVFILVPDEESEAGRGWEPSSRSRHQEAAVAGFEPRPRDSRHLSFHVSPLEEGGVLLPSGHARTSAGSSTAPGLL